MCFPADGGDADSQFNVGCMYASRALEGETLGANPLTPAKDDEEADSYFRLAAAQGHAPSQASLGRRLYAVEREKEAAEMAHDFEEAAHFAKLAADQGNSEGQFVLVGMCGVGDGVPPDFGEAAKWCQLSAAQGHAEALDVIDSLQENGMIPAPLPGTSITTVLLTSAASSQYNN